MSAVALLSAIGLTTGCGDSADPVEAGRKPGLAASTAAGKAAKHSEPLTAAKLKAALLTADQAVGFRITGSSSRDGAEPESSLDFKETVSPKVCRHVREAHGGDGEEAAAASSIMYRAGTSVAPRSTNLRSYTERAARARMKQLRTAVGACSRFSFSSWELFERVVPPASSRPQGGGRRRYADREVLAAIIFVATSGCTWR
ncbi:transposase, partial [Streptomyces sp. NPDC126514]|uniref:transposase n=1 Tax=Streptomyces sp. NPDC126514 TaxID=3155210 RepID=UPI0033291F44